MLTQRATKFPRRHPHRDHRATHRRGAPTHMRNTTERAPRPAASSSGRVYDRQSACERLLRRQYPDLRVYPLRKATTKALHHLFQKQIPHSLRQPPGARDALGADSTAGIDHLTLFRIFSQRRSPQHDPYLVFIKGGCVRDIVQGRAIGAINDIDIVHTMPFAKARFGKPYGLNAKRVQYYTQRAPGFKYIKVGNTARGNAVGPVDCTETKLNPSLNSYEAPLNTLMINVTHARGMPSELDRVYDITGCGMDHARRRIWTAPNHETLHDPAWLSGAKLWRMLRFRLRGNDVPLATREVIYRYWLDNHATLPPYVWRNPLLKHFGQIVAKEAVAREAATKANAPPSAPALALAPPPAKTVLRVAYERVVDLVGHDFDQISSLGLPAALGFVRMMFAHGLLTVPEQSITAARSRSKASIGTPPSASNADAPPTSSVPPVHVPPRSADAPVASPLQHSDVRACLRHLRDFAATTPPPTAHSLMQHLKLLLRVRLVSPLPLALMTRRAIAVPPFTYPSPPRARVYPLTPPAWKRVLQHLKQRVLVRANHLSRSASATEKLSLLDWWTVVHAAHPQAALSLHGKFVDALVATGSTLRTFPVKIRVQGLSYEELRKASAQVPCILQSTESDTPSAASISFAIGSDTIQGRWVRRDASGTASDDEDVYIDVQTRSLHDASPDQRRLCQLRES